MPKRGVLALFCLLFGLTFASAAGRAPVIAQAIEVDMALVLAIDCSFSVDANEFRLQMQGLGQAFMRPEVKEAIARVPGVASVHDLHVWSITSGKSSLTVHVVQRDDVTNAQALLLDIRQLVASKYDIHHSTIQIETTPCEQAVEEHSFGPAAQVEHADHTGHDHDEHEGAKQ